MKSIELFSGAGGASLGLARAGIEALIHVEWDKDACATATAAGHEHVHCGDVNDTRRLERALGDGMFQSNYPILLWSSFPCQAWSQAGLRKGAQDSRNGWPATVDAIDAVLPDWVACENVRGLTMHRKKANCQKGRDPNPKECPACYLEEVILFDLRLRFPYVEARVLNAADFGVPQTRKRLFIVAGPRPIRWPAPTHSKDGPVKWNGCGEALGITPNSSVIGGGRNASDGTRTHRDLTEGPSTTVAAQWGGGAGNAGPWIVGAGVTGESRPRTMDRPAATVSTMGTQYLMGTKPELLDRPSACVSATEVKGTNGKADGRWTASGGPIRASDTLWMATGRRRLTVEECAILQGFPEDYPWTGTKTNQYRQVGNAVPPILAEVIGRAIKEA